MPTSLFFCGNCFCHLDDWSILFCPSPRPPFILWSNFSLWSQDIFRPFSLLLHGLQLIFPTGDWSLVEETHESFFWFSPISYWSSAPGREGGGCSSDSAHWLRSFEQPALRFDPVSACWPYGAPRVNLHLPTCRLKWLIVPSSYCNLAGPEEGEEKWQVFSGIYFVKLKVK